MDYFNSLTQTQQLLVIVVGALIVFIVGTFIYKYFSQDRRMDGTKSPAMVAHNAVQAKAFSEDPNHITPLNEESVNLTPAVYAFFYTDWCGYCKQTHPAWEEVMRNMNGYKGAQIVKINCEENPELATLHGVKSYPTIKLLLNGIQDPNNTILYQGDRSPQDMARFLEESL